MKRVFYLSLVLIVFVAGFLAGALLSNKRADDLESFRQSSHNENIAEIRKRNFGEAFAKPLPDFKPSSADEVISLSYVGGIGKADRHLSLHGDGRLQLKVHGQTTLITTLREDSCASFFDKVLKSGIIHHDQAIIELKRDLMRPNVHISVTCLACPEIHISIPKLGINKVIEDDGASFEAENFPDIIEYQIVNQFVKGFVNLVPKDYPLWE